MAKSSFSRQDIFNLHSYKILYTKKAPNANFFENFPKTWKNFITITSKNQRTKTMFKSQYQIFRERDRHLRSKNWYIIHPFSLFNKYKQILLLCLYTVVLFLDLFFVAFDVRLAKEQNTYRVLGILNGISLAVVILNFFIGYIDRHTQTVILKQKKVAIHYLKTWFIIDVIPMVIFWLQKFNRNEKLFKATPGYKIFTMVRFIRMGRLLTISNYLHWFTTVIGLRGTRYILIRTTLLLFFYLHFTTCISVMIPDIFAKVYPEKAELSWINQLGEKFQKQNYVLTSFWLYCHGFRENLLKLECLGVTSNITPYNVEEVILSFIFVVSGHMLQVYTLVVLYNAFMDSYRTSIECHENRNALSAFCVLKHIPEKLVSKLQKLYQKFYRGHSFEDQFEVSNELHYEILLDVWKGEHVRNCKLFKNLISCGFEVTTLLRPILILNNTEVYNIGDQMTQMYFICSGSVAVYNAKGVEIGHLWDGHIFGVGNLRGDVSFHTEKVITIEDCRMFTISRKSVLILCKKSPEFRKYISEYQVEIDEDTIRDFQEQMPSVYRSRTHLLITSFD